MGCFSRFLGRVAGIKRGTNLPKRVESRSLRVESLEDRALLSVTAASIVPPVSPVYEADLVSRAALVSEAALGGGAVIDTAAAVDVPIAVPVFQDDAAGLQTDLRSAVPNHVNKVVTWDLAAQSDYKTFVIDADENENIVYLYGVSKDGDRKELARESVVWSDSLLLYSDNTAREVTFTASVQMVLGHINYVGGKTKNDNIVILGLAEDTDHIEVDQITYAAEVHTQKGKTETMQVVFEDITALNTEMLIGGVRSITLDCGAGYDTFNFAKMGVIYDIITTETGSEANDSLYFHGAEAGIKLNLGKTTAQSVISGQKGKLCLHNNIIEVEATQFKDVITTAANTITVFGNGGSDKITLIGEGVGDDGTRTLVALNGDSQRVSGRGSGTFDIRIEGDGTNSRVNLSSMKSGSVLSLYAKGNNIRVSGTKGNDGLTIIGNNVNVQGNDGDDTIEIIGANARAAGGNGNDAIFFMETYGKCTLDGGAGDDLVVGGSGSDTLKDRSGKNVLIGGLGADKIIGGKGSDILLANTTAVLDDRYKISGVSAYLSLFDAWQADDVIKYEYMLGSVSAADHEKDVLKRGGGVGNYIFANTNDVVPGNDFDTADAKADKGDKLFTDEPANRLVQAPPNMEDLPVVGLIIPGELAEHQVSSPFIPCDELDPVTSTSTQTDQPELSEGSAAIAASKGKLLLIDFPAAADLYRDRWLDPYHFALDGVFEDTFEDTFDFVIPSDAKAGDTLPNDILTGEVLAEDVPADDDEPGTRWA